MSDSVETANDRLEEIRRSTLDSYSSNLKRKIPLGKIGIYFFILFILFIISGVIYRTFFLTL